MNKYLLLSAAALISSVTAADATTGLYCFTFGTASGDPYCDGGRMKTGIDLGDAGGAFRSWTYLVSQCGSGQSSFGVGLAGKSPVLGNVSLMTNDVAGNCCGYTYLYYTLPTKIKNGKEWELWIGFSGTTFFQGNRGMLVDVSKNCQNRAKAHKGRPSSRAKVEELIRLRRNAKAAMNSH